MKNVRNKVLLSVAAMFGLALTGGLPAQAQPVAPPPAGAQPVSTTGLKEIIVTARRRQERLLNVPVNVAAVTGRTLQDLQVTQISQLPNLVPGLVIGHGVLSEGAFLTIHGIGITTLDPGVDSSVAFVVDGMPMEQGLAFESSLFDLADIQVMKGPQTLFFGKSSPGGVISLRTADPTDKDEVIASAAYNFGTMGPRTELILSGPVTDTLKMRLAGMFSRSEGYFHNQATPDLALGALGPFSSRAPKTRNWIVRLTTLWNPTSRFSARLKINLVGNYSTDPEGAEITSCPNGTGALFGVYPPWLAGAGCTLGDTLHLVNMNPAAFPGGLPGHGEDYLSTDQRWMTLELNYNLTPALDLSSITGFYHLISTSLFNDFGTSSAAPALATPNYFRRQDITEEIRVNSSFSGPVNFTAGAFFQRASVAQATNFMGNVTELGPAAAELYFPKLTVPIEAHSLYGEVRWNIMRKLQLAGGLRWSVENRAESAINMLAPTTFPIIVTDPTIHSTNTSPQITLRYKPTDNVTAYASWKKGYLSGSYGIAAPQLNVNTAGTAFTLSNGFGDEYAKGEEAGIKARLMNDHLSLNMTAYDYGYTGLQVGVVPAYTTQAVSTVTVNAGAARTYGVDLDAEFRPPMLEALTLHASVGWDHAVYTTLVNVPCWGGQTIAQGCTLLYKSGVNGGIGGYTAQNLSGTQMVRAPNWQANVGFQYNMDLGSDYTLTFTNNTQYSARFPTFLAVGRPNHDNFQGGYAKIDLGAQLTTPGDHWEFSVIGNDVTNKITASVCSNGPFSNEIFPGETTGVATYSGPIDGVSCFVDPGRETWIRVTWKPSVHW